MIKMNKEYVSKWLEKLKNYWFNKYIEKTTSLFTKVTYYQETPFMNPYSTFEEIVDE